MVTFVEMPPFTRRFREFLTDTALRELQNDLMHAPDIGAVMPGCGGLRKLRRGDPRRGKGKRGGCRIIYLNHPGAARIDLVAIYGKDERDDLSNEQKKSLKKLAEEARREAKYTAEEKGKDRK